MNYTVKETFYTLQGEGAQTGRAAVFLRFSGCNLWSGRATDREKGQGGCSRWCDTDFVGTDGAGGGRFPAPSQLARHVAAAWLGPADRKFVVCTGGEPLLQLDKPLLSALHDEGFSVAVETNGTRPVPPGIDWVCVSPKAGGQLVVRSGNELKLVVQQEGMHPSAFELLDFEHFFLQPMDGPHQDQFQRFAIKHCLAHPRWRLSLQTHKYLGIR